MNIEALTIILKQDINDLIDISDVLEKDYKLSKIEVQIIQSRIQNISKNIVKLIDYVEKDVKKQSNDVIKTGDGELLIKKETEKKEIPITPVQTEENIHSESYKTASEETEEKPLAQKNDLQEQSIEQPVKKESQKTIKNSPPAIETEKEPKVEPKSPKTVAERFSESGTASVNDRVGLGKQLIDRSSQIGQKPIADLHKAIKLNDRIGYIKELFGGNAETYKVTVDTINGLSSFEEAIKYINDHFDWEQESDHFKSFIDLIFRRFSI